MKRPPYPSTPNEASEWFRKNGIAVSQWAEAQGVQRHIVVDLLRGRLKGHRGESHKAAVLLGLKADPEKAESDDARAKRAA